MQCRPLVQARRVKRLQCFSIEGLCSKIFPGGSLEKNAGRPVFVCMYVCPSIFASGARTVGRIGTGEYSLYANEKRKNDGNDFGPIGCTWHLPRAIAQILAKSFRQGCRPNQWTDSANSWGADSHHGWAQCLRVSNSGAPSLVWEARKY